MLNTIRNFAVPQKNVNLKQNKSPNFKGLQHTLPKDVLEITGSQTKAKVFTNNINYQTFEQIKKICSHPVFNDIPVRIMPDTHAGKSSVVGFTAPIGAMGAVIPSLISGDIGCGMLCVSLDTLGENIDYEKLDKVIRETLISAREKKPSVYGAHAKKIEKEVGSLCKDKYKISADDSMSSLGTLGGGNHFIEIDSDDNGNKYLIIHTGSRQFGKKVHDYHQKIANEQNPYRIRDWSYFTGDEAKSYLEDMQIAVRFSQLNRRIIADEILKRMGWKEKESFESIHNYISKDGIIRKGAISAQAGEKILIPLNMRDGAIIAEGHGNADWNNSAPHGAGRQFSRSEASELITLEEYQDSMKGIHSSCISKSTIDESPLAYKDANEIIDNITETATIEKIVKPEFNFKD